MKVPYLDLTRAAAAGAGALASAFARVHASGRYVLGPEVEAFERDFSAFAGAAHGVGCASGTDAITLALRALDVGEGDDVLTVSMTCAPTATGILNAGARPVFVEVDPRTLTLDPGRLPAALTLRTRAIVPVHLYGRPAAMEEIAFFARAHHLALVEDCAQAHGARLGGKSVGTFGDAGIWSFYPTKNLGALGDGGLVTTSRDDVADRVRRLRMYGYATRNDSLEPGFNSRLDELQAAFLSERLRHLPDANRRRAAIAARYDERLRGTVETPPAAAPGAVPCHHLYVVRVAEREAVRERLSAAGIGTGVHYPRSVHEQPAFASFPRGALPETERAAREVLSLPLYPQLTDGEADLVARALRDAVRR